MTLIPENNQNNPDNLRRNKAIIGAASVFVVGWMISGILYDIFEDSKWLPHWLLVSLTLLLPFFLAISSWYAAMKEPPPNPITPPGKSGGVGLKRLTAFFNALVAFFISWFMVGLFLGQMLDSVNGIYATLATILPMILPLAIAIRVYMNTMKPKHQPTNGFPVIPKKTKDTP